MSVFSDIIGHEPILRVLEHALVKPAHAYLFCGPRGVGKKLVAETFAAELLKEKTLSSHPDFVCLTREEGAREIVVKQARELIARMQLTSARGGYKVALIEEADRLNEEAANALLKAVEEPSANTVYIFIAEQSDRLPATLRSRLVKIEFGRVKTEVIEKWLSSSYLSSRGTRDLAPLPDGSRSLSPPPSLASAVAPSDSARDDKKKGERSFKDIAEQSRGCPGVAFRLAFSEEEAWFDAIDWQAMIQNLLTSPTGQKLQTIEKLTQTVDSQPDPETAWREALDHLMRALDHSFIDAPEVAARLGQGLSHAWKLVGGAIPPRLAIEYAILPEEAKQGRMRPRILP